MKSSNVVGRFPSSMNWQLKASVGKNNMRCVE